MTVYDIQGSINHAKDALKINHKFRQPATLLAIIYSLKKDTPNIEKYSLMAINNGEAPEDLKEATEYYRSSLAEKEAAQNE